MEKTPQVQISEQSVNRKKTTQRNHEAFVIPPSLQEHASEPLYILVALWAQQQNRWVSRTEVQETFGIADRRASFQISYISRQNKRVTCRIRAIRKEGSSAPHHQIRVTSVILTRDAEKTPPAPPKNRPGKRRRVGNVTPELRSLFNSLTGSRSTCSN